MDSEAVYQPIFLVNTVYLCKSSLTDIRASLVVVEVRLKGAGLPCRNIHSGSSADRCQTEQLNRIIGNIKRCVYADTPKRWISMLLLTLCYITPDMQILAIHHYTYTVSRAHEFRKRCHSVV